MRRFNLLILSLFLGTTLIANPEKPAETNAAAAKGTIKGRIIEEGSNIPLEYANIAIFSAEDSSLVGGSITDPNGIFAITNLAPGNYYLDAKFLGYEHTKRSDIIIRRGITQLDLGDLELIPASENLAEVTVTAQDRPIIYELDKKIVDPSQFPTAASGTATDILAQTPSVVVDIEGNVTLRGSSNFTVLIDGRPTPFDPEDALDQIPASTIQNIEIITNPSAKYDPDGNAGIINIKTKKSKLIGLSGILNATADSYGSLTGDFLLNYKMEKFNVYLNGDRSNRYGQGDFESTTITYGEDTITTLASGFRERGRESWSVKSGVDYFVNDKNTITLNVSLNGNNRVTGGESDYREYSTSGYDILSQTISSNEGGGLDVAFTLDYKKTFDREGQEFTMYAYYENGSGEEINYYDQFDGSEALIEGLRSWEIGDNQGFRIQADYVQPIGISHKLEAGLQSRIDRSYEWNDVFWYTDEGVNYEPGSDSEFYTDTWFNRDIHSGYVTFSNKGSRFGYQLGVRGEYTDRTLDYSGADEPYEINRFDYFPTLHLSMQLPADQQMLASYSRRIDRPRSWYLEPFYTYMDAYNVRVGNPGIQPEYIDSYELGYQKQIGKGFLSAELYHRKTTNNIERISSVLEGNVLLRSQENVGISLSSGLELMLNTRPADWWIFNLMGNVYDYRIEGEYLGRDYSQQSNNWNARFSNIFNIGKNSKIQFDGMYNSPSTTLQGRREGFMFTNLAWRQDLFEQKLNVTFTVRDVLNTAKFGFEASEPDFYSQRKFDMRSPVFAITLAYKINNYREKKGGYGRGEEGEGMDMGDGDF